VALPPEQTKKKTKNKKMKMKNCRERVSFLFSRAEIINRRFVCQLEKTVIIVIILIKKSAFMKFH